MSILLSSSTLAAALAATALADATHVTTPRGAATHVRDRHYDLC